jgi:hypothetical protein
MSVIVALALIAAIGYYLSLRIHPLTRCKQCKSISRNYDIIYTSSRHTCGQCGGSGREDRLGVRLFLGGTGGTGVFPKRS